MNPVPTKQHQERSLESPYPSAKTRGTSLPALRPALFASPSCAPLIPYVFPASALAALPNLSDPLMIHGQINDLFLTKLQHELYQAQQKLDFLDVHLIQQFQDFCKTQRLPPTPPIDIIKTNWTCVTLDWVKLKRAFSKISVFSEMERTHPFGYSRATEAVLCLKYLLYDKITNRYLKPRDIVTPEFLTILSAEAIIAQRVYVAPSHIRHTSHSSVTLLIGDEDMRILKASPQQLAKDFAIALINKN